MHVLFFLQTGIISDGESLYKEVYVLYVVHTTNDTLVS